jgi:uncharacterized protein
MRGIYAILLLILSNIFMTLAWYGHLQFKKISWLHIGGLFTVILISWGLAFFEYIFQVPANRLGFKENGGPFSLFQLKIIQEVISIVVFTFFAIIVFKTDKLNWNYLIGFVFMILAVYFVFKK